MVDDVSQRKKNKAEPSPKEYIRAESSAFFAAAVNVSQSHFAYSSCSWDVFAYELLSNQLRALRLLLGQFSMIIQDVDWAVKGLNYILWFIHKKSTLYPQAGKGAFARFSRLLGAEKDSFKKVMHRRQLFLRLHDCAHGEGDVDALLAVAACQ